MNVKEKAKDIRNTVSALFIALKKKETPWYAKAAAGITVAYALSPIDLIPDFIPVLGYLDDLIILPLLAAFAIKLIPPEVMKECKIEAEGLWANGKPKRWYYAIPIVIIWAIVLGLILAAVVRSVN